MLIVNRGAFKLTLYKNLKRAKTYGIAVGQVGLETPGRPLQHPEQGREPGLARAGLRLGGRPARQGHPGRRPENPIKARWMGIFDGAGIHGTTADDSIGTAASHGCIRMRIPEVIELYDEVPVGAPVYIA